MVKYIPFGIHNASRASAVPRTEFIVSNLFERSDNSLVKCPIFTMYDNVGRGGVSTVLVRIFINF